MEREWVLNVLTEILERNEILNKFAARFSKAGKQVTGWASLTENGLGRLVCRLNNWV